MAMRTRSRRGSALLMVMVVVMVMFMLGVALLDLTMNSLYRSQYDLLRAQSLDMAEAGAEKAIYYLRNTAPDGSTDGSWRTAGLTETLSGAGSYTLSVASGSGDNGGKLVITSTGTATLGSKSRSRRLRVVITYSRENVSVWDNVLFAGVGQGGSSINGNVLIAGKVNLQGDPEPFTDLNGNGRWDPGEPFVDWNDNGTYNAGLQSTDQALTMGGSAGVINNYSGMPTTLSSVIPACPTTVVGGQTVQSLSAKLRVKHGQVSLSGAAAVGAASSGGTPPVKGPMDGCYVTDGYSGGASSVYADNGTSHGYDLSTVTLPFPDVVSSETIGGFTYASHMAYLSSVGLNITGPLNLQPDQVYAASDIYGDSVIADGLGNLTISGIVFVNGDININHGHGSDNKTFTYSGRGTLAASGSASVHSDLIPKTYFPTTDAIGLVARHQLHLADGSGDSHLTLAGAFYGQEQVTSQKQNKIAGTLVSTYFSMSNVPDIWQVPALATNLPPGMPGATPIWVVSTPVNSWQELAPP
jgi:hypothetical protein